MSLVAAAASAVATATGLLTVDPVRLRAALVLSGHAASLTPY